MAYFEPHRLMSMVFGRFDNIKFCPPSKIFSSKWFDLIYLDLQYLILTAGSAS